MLHNTVSIQLIWSVSIMIDQLPYQYLQNHFGRITQQELTSNVAFVYWYSIHWYLMLRRGPLLILRFKGQCSNFPNSDIRFCDLCLFKISLALNNTQDHFSLKICSTNIVEPVYLVCYFSRNFSFVRQVEANQIFDGFEQGNICFKLVGLEHLL